MRKGYTMTYQMRKKQRQQREIIIQYALKFVGVVLLAFLIVRFVCFSFTIQGDSMSPSIKKGDKHLVNRLIYQIKGPSRYDVIVFKADDKNGNYYVKRVVGLPGEKVQIKNGRIYHHFTTNNIMYMNIFIRFYLKTYHILFSFCYQCINFFFRHCQRVAHGHTG